MKTAAICTVVGGLAFGLMAMQMDWDTETEGTEEGTAEVKKEEPAPLVAKQQQTKKLKFPVDLAPAARAGAVPGAAAFQADSKTYPMVFMKANGAVYQAWQDRLNDEWVPESVEATQLVVVLGPHRKIFVDVTTYPSGAPPIERFRWELEVSVVEPRTGKVRANRNFHNVPRAIKPVEAWELTEIGQPVAFKTVHKWVVNNARANFPELSHPAPIVTVVE